MDYHKMLLQDGSVVVSETEYKKLLKRLNVEGIEIFAFDLPKGKVSIELITEEEK